MINLKDFCEAVEYKISGGSEFQWECFGANARYLDADDTSYDSSKYSINAIFDSVSYIVYQMEVWDYANNREYRWMHPDYAKAYKDEAKVRKVKKNESCDGRKFIDLEVADDILEKANALVNGLDYDTRVKVPVDFSDEELLQYMKLAHERDMTFNELVEEALLHAIAEYERDPEGMKARATQWKEQHED